FSLDICISFSQAEDGIRDRNVTGVQTCALPISECATTCTAVEPLPPKCCSATSRALTESEPLACQPAPASALNTVGAKAPKPISTTAQATATQRALSTIARPMRANAPPVGGAAVSGAASAPGGLLVMTAPRIPWGVCNVVIYTPRGIKWASVGDRGHRPRGAGLI